MPIAHCAVPGDHCPLPIARPNRMCGAIELNENESITLEKNSYFIIKESVS